VQSWIDNHKRLKTLLHEIHLLSLAWSGLMPRRKNAAADDPEHRPHPLANHSATSFPNSTLMDQIEDPRSCPSSNTTSGFLLWWGLSLFLFKLSSRRQLDYQLNTDGPEVLNNSTAWPARAS